MRNSKLKAINRQIQNLFQASPKQTLSKYQQTAVPAYEEYRGCSICEEVRRQNYRLKQDVIRTQELQEEVKGLKQELTGVQELYSLKCKEVQLLQQRLEEAQGRLEDVLEQKDKFRSSSYVYFQKLLAGEH